MPRYKHAEEEEASSLGSIGSMGSIQLNEGPSSMTTHIRYKMGRGLWRSRSKLEQGLLVAVGTLILLVILFVILLSSSKPKTETRILHITSHTEGEVCLTPNCIKSAAHILSSLDLTADPCEDFYQYSCGGWAAENPIPVGKSTWGNFGKLELQNQLVIRHILENPATKYRSEAERKAKRYYDSCMDSNNMIEKLGAQPMLDLLKKIGGWNIAGNFNLKAWSLQRTLQVVHNEYNMGGLFSWAVGEDDKNSSRYIIQISQGGLTLPARENYLNKTANRNLLGAYLEYMTRVGILLGGEHMSTLGQMRDVLDFETQLAAITPTAEDIRDQAKMYHLMSLVELQKLAPFIYWRPYFSSALKKINRFIGPEEMVVVRAPEYLEKMSALVSSYLKTDVGKITLNNYLVWQTVQSLTCCLPRAFRDAHKNLRKILMGSEGGEELWLTCVSNTNNVIGFATGAMFVRQVFQPDYKLMAEEMINEIRNAFLDIVKDYKWMDDETRAAAINKAKAISDMIGFPEYILDPRLLDKKYIDLEIVENEYFMNNIRVSQYNLRKNVENLYKAVNKTKWEMIPSAVNAYYAPTKNQIVFPAGIMRAPFYSKNQPASLNFGALGVVMGHELIHAFDDLGREYDLNGNLYKWWKNETTERFKEKANCVVRQYFKYEVNGKYVNGNLTLGENIADNGGVKAAFNAFKKIEALKKELFLPGLNRTHRQLFFLSYAQVWCSSSTEEATLLQMEKDTHSPSKFRVIGSLSNLEEFAKEFNCPTGSRMNPKEKCEIW